MFHCDGCWDNPCTCGKAYQHMDRGQRAALARVLLADDLPRGMAPSLDAFTPAMCGTGNPEAGDYAGLMEAIEPGGCALAVCASKKG